MNHHAYIFTGEYIAAVRNKALAYAKGVNCETAACCPPKQCLSCRTFDSGNHPDIFFVKGTKQSGIGVDDVREQIIMPMAVKPFKYKYKVFIVEGQITSAAQNALLKTLEEPAPYGIFLFISLNTHGFLPTLLSRCVESRLTHATGDIAANALESGSSICALAKEIATAVEGADIPEAFALYRKIEPLSKDELNEFLNTLYVVYGEKIRNVSNPPQAWLKAATALSRTKHILTQNGNTQLAIELMLLNLGSLRFL